MLILLSKRRDCDGWKCTTELHVVFLPAYTSSNIEPIEWE